VFTIKSYLAITLSFVLLPAFAQEPSAMSEEKMQEMMQGMQKMANCFQNIDQSKLEGLADEGKAMEEKLKKLCADGERSKAQQEAMAFGMKYMNSEEFKTLKQCGEMAKGMMPEMPDYSVYKDEGSENSSNRHVCDDR